MLTGFKRKEKRRGTATIRLFSALSGIVYWNRPTFEKLIHTSARRRGSPAPTAKEVSTGSRGTWHASLSPLYTLPQFAIHFSLSTHSQPLYKRCKSHLASVHIWRTARGWLSSSCNLIFKLLDDLSWHKQVRDLFFMHRSMSMRTYECVKCHCCHHSTRMRLRKGTDVLSQGSETVGGTWLNRPRSHFTLEYALHHP